MSMALRVLAGATAATGIDGIDWEYRFESDSITGLSDTDSVTTWPDTSGNSRDATESTNPPYYSVNQFGSLPGVFFADGDYDRLATATTPVLTQPNTVWIVGSTSTTAAATMLDTADTAGGNRHQIARQSATETQIYAGTAFNAALVSNGAGVWAFEVNGSSSKAWKGGGTAATGDAGTQSLSGMTIGNRYATTNIRGAGAPFGAVLLYNGIHSTADLNLVGNYLADKFGLSWSDVT